MVLRVADEVSIAICFRALARAAVSWKLSSKAFSGD
jgi:hypothetical protein